MTSDDSSQAGSAPEASSARALGQWVATLAEDAVCVAEVSRQFAPGSPLRAPLRAGLRHLLHIERLARGIEALAMLEVAIMLRVTALLASPAEELDDETVLRLRADTPLIEELFPEEKGVIWAFCEALIERERWLPSEEPILAVGAAAKALGAEDDNASPTTVGEPAGVDREPTTSDEIRDDAPPTSDQPIETVSSDANPAPADPALDDLQSELVARASHTLDRDAAPSAHVFAEDAVDVADVGGDSTDAAVRAGSGEEATSPAAPPVTTDELVERIRAWATSYQPPTFGNKPHDLTRARAFVRTRVSAWSGS